MSQKDNEDIDSQNDDVDDTENLGDENGGSDSQRDEEESGSKVDTDGDEDTDDPTELKEQLRKQREENARMFERVQKSKGLMKKRDPATGKDIWVKKEKSVAQDGNSNVQQDSAKKDDLSMDDFYALQEAKVPREDVESVKKFAKANGMTIPEALHDDIVKTTLANRAEERRSANASNTDKTRRNPSRQTPESLLSRAQRTGELPDSDEDIEALAEARLNRK